MADRISELPVASEAIAGNDLVAVTNVSEPGTGQTQQFTQDQLTASQKILNFRTATELTISSGAITKTQSWHTIDTQADAASDDLDTINGGVDGDILFVRPANDARTIVVKHETGNIRCIGGSDFTLDDEEDFVIFVYDASLSAWIASYASGESAKTYYPCQGRLTLESGVPISTSEQSNKGTVYFTPFTGDYLCIYSTTLSKWIDYQFGELSLSLAALTASKPHDIFAYINSGSPAIEALAWTDASTRATALAYKNGVLVKNTDNSRRYLGTIYIDASNKCQDTLTQAYVWNYQNQILRRMYMAETTSHTYNGAARLWNNSETNNRFDFVCGLTSTLSTIGYSRIKAGTDAYYGFSYIYYDGVNVGYLLGNYNVQTISAGGGIVQSTGAGYHYINIYEGGNDNNSTFINFFLYSTMMR